MTIRRKVLPALLVVISLLAFGVGNVSATSDAVHIVRSGETLYSIAAKYNTTVAHLASINNITDPNLIRAGHRLRVTGTAHGLAENKPILKDGPWWGKVIVGRVPIRPEPAQRGIISDGKRRSLDNRLYYGDTVQVLKAINGEQVFEGNNYWYLIEAEEPQYVYSA